MYRKNKLLVVVILFCFLTWANANTIDLICTTGKLCSFELQKIVDSNQAHRCCKQNNGKNNTLTDKSNANNNPKCGDFSSKLETYIKQDVKTVHTNVGFVTNIIIPQSVCTAIILHSNFSSYQTKLSNPAIFLKSCSFLS